ncbi:hypothetical protein DM02DRAFT_652438 [Periconia macrospinosa]|uniref:Uncharacterized protein n=1 Tax=Periconia macrospinosa TaxID=97972 RepID=A0A2V1DZK6_9PLEO|nr:hypothetical protein DM02DRAFT_652438 [Periconia macrospinosa]
MISSPVPYDGSSSSSASSSLKASKSTAPSVVPAKLYFAYSCSRPGLVAFFIYATHSVQKIPNPNPYFFDSGCAFAIVPSLDSVLHEREIARQAGRNADRVISSAVILAAELNDHRFHNITFLHLLLKLFKELRVNALLMDLFTGVEPND